MLEQAIGLKEVARLKGISVRTIWNNFSTWRDMRDEKGNRILRVEKSASNGPIRLYYSDVSKVMQRIANQSGSN